MFFFFLRGGGGLSGDERIVSCVQGVSDRVQLLLILIGVQEALFSLNSNQSKDKLHRFESPPERLLFCRFLNGDALQTVSLVVLFVFLLRGGVYEATSKWSRVFRQCPTWCSLSLFWFAFENSNQNRDKLGRFESLPEHLLFLLFS